MLRSVCLSVVTLVIFSVKRLNMVKLIMIIIIIIIITMYAFLYRHRS